MPIKSYKLGPGELELDTLDVSLQVVGCQVNPTENVSTTDAIPTLGGEELPSEDVASYTYSLSGQLLQDISLAGVVDWSWANEGEEVPFRFVPSTAEGREVTGVLRVVPLTIGGPEVKRRPTSDFDWKCIGKPVLGAL